MVNACQIYVLLCTVPGLFAAAFPWAEVQVDAADVELEFPASRLTRESRDTKEDGQRSPPPLDDRFATAWFTSQNEDGSSGVAPKNLAVLFPIGSLPTFKGLPAGCTCVNPSQYNLVCGTDNVTYQNEHRLNCFRRCANASLRVKHWGACAAPSS